MKIRNSNHSRNKALNNRNTEKPSRETVKHSLFLDTLKNQNVESVNLEVFLENIDEYAEKLEKEPIYENLRRYKEAVRQFMAQVIDQLYSVDEQHFFDRNSRRRVYVIVRKIDAKLEQLTKQFMTNQSNTLILAEKLDEIRGMVLDLYT